MRGGGAAPTTAIHPGVQGPGPRKQIKEGCRAGWGPHPEDPEEVSLPCRPSPRSSRGGAGDCPAGGCLRLTLTPRNKRLRTVGPQVTHI